MDDFPMLLLQTVKHGADVGLFDGPELAGRGTDIEAHRTWRKAKLLDPIGDKVGFLWPV